MVFGQTKSNSITKKRKDKVAKENKTKTRKKNNWFFV